MHTPNPIHTANNETFAHQDRSSAGPPYGDAHPISPSIVTAAPLELPRVFGDNMVVQRDNPVNVWGWSKSGELVSVTLNGQSAKATAGADGTWSLQLPAMPVCAKPLEFQVQSAGV